MANLGRMTTLDEVTPDLDAWIAATTENDSINSIAQEIGVPQRTLAYHVKNGELTAWEIVKIARAYGKSPILALRYFGYITDHEIESASNGYMLDRAPIRDVVNTLVKFLENYYFVAGSASQQADPQFAAAMLDLFAAEYSGLTEGEIRQDLRAMGRKSRADADSRIREIDPKWRGLDAVNAENTLNEKSTPAEVVHLSKRRSHLVEVPEDIAALDPGYSADLEADQ